MSIVLNGTDQYAQILEAIDAGRPVTVVGWYKSDSDTAVQAVASIADKDSDVHYRVLGLLGSVGGDPIAANERDASNNEWAASTVGYTANTWEHGLAEFGSATSRKVLIDGGNGDEETTSITPAGLDKTAIGVICRSTLAWFFSGKLAEVAIWDMVLSSQQKTDLANGAAASSIESGNLLAYWPLYDDADDESGNSKNLTAVGSPSFDTGDHPTITNVYEEGTKTVTATATVSLASESGPWNEGILTVTSAVTVSLSKDSYQSQAEWPLARASDYDGDLWWDRDAEVWGSTYTIEPGSWVEYVLMIGEEGEVYFGTV